MIADGLPCGYVTGVHESLVAGIPGLKSETWGTLRVFPVILVRKEDLGTGRSPYLPCRTFNFEFLRSLFSRPLRDCIMFPNSTPDYVP